MASKVAKRLIGQAREAMETGRKSCLLREKCVRPNGYGLIHFRNGLDGKSGYRQFSTHRFVFEAIFGPLADGINVLHSCDNPPCFNPRHLFAGTPAKNMEDKVEKGRQAKGECCNKGKLTAKTVREIRTLRSQGIPYAQIAARFGISIPGACAAATRRNWKHVA
jgi:hypothetical protein